METPFFGRYQNLDLTLSREGLVTALKKTRKVVFFCSTHTINEDRYKTAICKCATGWEVVLIVSNNSDDIQNGIPIYIYQISG